MKEGLTIREVMQRTGIRSDRTVRNWIRAGRLHPLPGSGGQGKALRFDAAEVVTLDVTRQPTAADIACFARIMHAHATGKTLDLDDLPLFKPRVLTFQEAMQLEGRADLAADEKAALDQWYTRVETIRDSTGCTLGAAMQKTKRRPRAPSVSGISPVVVQHAKQCGGVLSRQEMQFLGAAFLVATSPWLGVVDSGKLLGAAWHYLSSVADQAGDAASEGLAEKALDVLRDWHDAVEPDIADRIGQAKGRTNAPRRLAQYHRAWSQVRVLIAGNDPSASGASWFTPPRHWKAARKATSVAAGHDKKRKELPSTSAVCVALGTLTRRRVYRQQGKRLWESIGRKLGRAYMQKTLAFIMQSPAA